MIEWITNRTPRASDADDRNHVAVKARIDCDYYVTIDWELVPLGMAWAHTPRWRPLAESAGTAEPAQPAKPTLAIGQRWKRRDGRVVTVDRYDSNHSCGATHPFWAERLSYRADGMFNGDGKPGSGFDLVELIEPATTPRRFVSISRTVWMDQGGSQCHTLDAIADDGTAWWMVPGETGWQQLPVLPDREASVAS